MSNLPVKFEDYQFRSSPEMNWTHFTMMDGLTEYVHVFANGCIKSYFRNKTRFFCRFYILKLKQNVGSYDIVNEIKRFFKCKLHYSLVMRICLTIAVIHDLSANHLAVSTGWTCFTGCTIKLIVICTSRTGGTGVVYTVRSWWTQHWNIET